MTEPEEPVDIEPGWAGLSILFFWWRWRWVHVLLRHEVTDDICACGMAWGPQ